MQRRFRRGKTYNHFHDPDERSPDVLKLRELHAAMDRAVLDAYGWNDIPTDCGFLLDYEEEDDDEGSRKRRKPWRYRWPERYQQAAPRPQIQGGRKWQPVRRSVSWNQGFTERLDGR